MRTALAIVFSALLVVAQSVTTTEPVSCLTGVAKCCCSDCTTSCCTPNPNPPQSQTPTPARAVSQNQLPSVAPVCEPLLSFPTERAMAPPCSFRTAITLSDAPLYQRHCAYLI
jgi:hypothetical protein